jgi:alpha-mannosidase
MNNHWHTNYRAEQDGPTTFRYSLLPHKQYDPVAAQRFGIERSQPLVVKKARGAAPSGHPFLELDTPDVIVTSIKPSEDGKAWIVRLFAAAGRPAKVGLRWGDSAPKAVFLSNLAEERGEAVTFPLDIPAWGILTLRAEL